MVPTEAIIIIADTTDVISLVVRLEAADGQVALSPGAGAGEAVGDPVPSGDLSVTGQLHQIPRGLPRTLLIPLNEVVLCSLLRVQVTVAEPPREEDADGDWVSTGRAQSPAERKAGGAEGAHTGRGPSGLSQAEGPGAPEARGHTDRADQQGQQVEEDPGHGGRRVLPSALRLPSWTGLSRPPFDPLPCSSRRRGRACQSSARPCPGSQLPSQP